MPMILPRSADKQIGRWVYTLVRSDKRRPRAGMKVEVGTYLSGRRPPVHRFHFDHANLDRATVYIYHLRSTVTFTCWGEKIIRSNQRLVSYRDTDGMKGK